VRLNPEGFVLPQKKVGLNPEGFVLLEKKKGWPLRVLRFLKKRGAEP